MIAIRGAICADANSRGAIFAASQALLEEIRRRNELSPSQIIAAFFTMTPDLDAAYPATAARELGWTGVPMLGAQETMVQGSPDRMIRLLLLTSIASEPRHVYLGSAASLRPDLTEPGDAEFSVGSATRQRGAEAKLGRLLVIGLGLIGGSLAAAARVSGFFAGVIGYDREREHAREAANLGLIDREAARLESELAVADVVVLAAPVAEIIGMLPHVGRHAKRGALITDVGSSKRGIVAEMAKLPGHLQAIGGHPMAGGTGSGPAAARPDLFRSAPWALVPISGAIPATTARAERLVRALGGEPLVISAEEHDRAVAFTSHLPALVAAALVEAVESLGGEGAALAGPGLVSATRLARGGAEMAAQMIAANADEVGRANDVFTRTMSDLHELRDDPNGLWERLERARQTLLGWGRES